MNKKTKTGDDKNIDRQISNRDYSKSLVGKIFEELDIKDFLPARDRGDTKPNLVKPIRKFSEKTINPRYKVKDEKEKADEITTANNLIVVKKEAKKRANDNEGRGDIIIEQNTKNLKKLSEKKTTEESKEKSSVLITISDEVEDNSGPEKNSKSTNQSHHKKKIEERMKAKTAAKNNVLDLNDSQYKKYLDLEERRRIRERYTFKNTTKICDKIDNSKGNTRNDDAKKQFEDEAGDKVKSTETVITKPIQQETTKPNQSETTKQVKRSKEPTSVNRKPIIKTIKLKNDNRVYKAVTFVDQKELRTPLQIKIPISYRKEKQSVSTNTFRSKIKAASSKVSVEMKSKKKEKNHAVKRISSPVMTVKNHDAPATEVAKWAPSCLSGHTKPYYEAWVDTTLAAITKCTKDDKLYSENQNIIRTFKRALSQRPPTPDLLYEDFKDERYTGRITVRHGNVKSSVK